MRVTLLSTYDERGGAARAALRLHRALPSAGVESHLLVQRRFGNEAGVVGPRGGPEGGLAGLLAAWRPRLDSIPVRLRRHRRRDALFSPAWLPEGIERRVETAGPDVVHLHWVGFGFVRPETLPRLNRPLVWTLHDSWAFTGGCHLPGACVRYRGACGSCPALESDRERDLSRRVFERKRRSWRGLPIRVVAPSRWIADAARSSALFHDAAIDVIPNGVDLRRFRPIDRRDARLALGLDPEQRVVLYNGLEGLDDPNKNFDALWSALQLLAGREPVRLLVVGAGGPSDPTRGAPDASRRVAIHFAGAVDDEERFALHLAAADLVALPSRQENLPNLAVEAMACGRPTVAFRVGGIPELVEHGATGYLAEPYGVEELARGIAWVLEDPERARALGERARVRAEQSYGAEVVARSHRALYEEVRERFRVDFEAGAKRAGQSPRAS